MAPITDHPLRYALANELHARPFPRMTTPCRVLVLAIKQKHDAAARDRGQDRAPMVALLDRHGAPHPPPEATHWSGRVGRHLLKMGTAY